jgi:Na+/melibiose symporter-like transporter
MFGVFLFLTYFMSTVLGFKPFPTGLAFLPMIGGLMVSAQTAPLVVARLGTKVPVIVGFSVAALGMLWFTRLDLTSSYASGVLPGLIVVGLGLGFVFPPAMSGATDRVDPHHAGVASAGVNTFQQIGGSIGTAVLSALASSAATSYLVGRDATDPLVQAQAGMESYTRVFLASAIVFALGAVVAGLLLRHGALDRDPAAGVVVAH